MAVQQGASPAALVELRLRKGYQLIAALRCNLIFVRSEEFHKVGIVDNSLEAMRADVPGSIFSGFDGTLFNTVGGLHWRHKSVKIASDGLQVLPAEKRRYREGRGS